MDFGIYATVLIPFPSLHIITGVYNSRVRGEWKSSLSRGFLTRMFTSLRWRVFSVLVWIASSLFYRASGRCDNQCSGHGTCLTDDVCSCYDNFGVGLSRDSGDCSDHICPFEIGMYNDDNCHLHLHLYTSIISSVDLLPVRHFLLQHGWIIRISQGGFINIWNVLERAYAIENLEIVNVLWATRAR